MCLCRGTMCAPGRLEGHADAMTGMTSLTGHRGCNKGLLTTLLSDQSLLTVPFPDRAC